MTQMNHGTRAGWYPEGNGSRWQRWHDGNSMTSKRRSPAPESPWLWVAAGVMCAFGGGFIAVIAAGETSLGGMIGRLLGIALAGAGWVITMVGVIALGVRLGMRHAHHEHPPD